MSLSCTNFYNAPHLSVKNSFKTVSFKGQELITPEVTEKLKQIGDEIEKVHKIAILTHNNPDGDAIGSSAALKNLISSKYPDKKVDAFIVNGFAKGFKCLNDVESFEILDKNSDLKSIKKRGYDLAISVDCPEKKMMNKGSEIFDSAKRKVKIDHHPERENFADINLTCPDASSASQVVLLLSESMKQPLNKDLASDIYLAMVTDTQGFRYLKKPAGVFEDASKLTKSGFDERKTYTSAMDYMPKAALNFYADVLKGVKYSQDGKIAYFVDDNTINKKGIEKTDVKDFYLKLAGIIMPNIEGVKIAVRMSRQDDSTNGSIRGNGVAVNDFAEKLGGGGHEFAAGFSTKTKTPEQIVSDLSNYLKSKEQGN